MLSFLSRGVLDEILNLNESVSEDFPSYSLIQIEGDLSRRRGKCDNLKCSERLFIRLSFDLC